MDVTQLDVFRFCRFLRHVGKIMVVFVLALVLAIYYSTMKHGIVPGMHSSSAGIAAAATLGAALYTGLVVLVLWSYLACFLTQPGHAAAAELEAWEQLAYEQQQRRQHQWEGEMGRVAVNRPRYCRKCKAWKPPRAHHDSMTGRCVLRMDHYCIWVLNCVGLLNYKFFALFLFYACLACTASAALLIKPCMDAFGTSSPTVGGLILTFITFVFSVAFSLALMGFVFMHGRLCARNMTTIEAYEKRPVNPWPYDHGTLQNFQEVFGRDRRYWLLPMHTPNYARSMLDDALRVPPPPEELLGIRDTV
ncbi:hypothetical protein CHLNCDRAFT_142811 [Chlorella variabilis]|uniref:S-acyltransferase n=1 Tax=Chlorella variabilis TaxID=554065 RepID=E1Z8T3_CHLVA|nr:hypothetical protein CHLNCDRAFT_142811 [Chlorella variabilis]EFN57662.1 hypothetical protein CHLNCDRAFT_142811 [Chlorella variabilis]|eukprot:XP_005849764.1 hypothetical protein CHLNCDRAFT_142811 [Chlorella variabilis]